MAALKRKSIRGGAVMIISQGISIVIQVTSTVVLARLLTPGDYGVMAMVMTVTSFAGLFRDLGLSSAAIQTKNLSRAQQNNLFWLNVTMGTVLTVIVAAASPLVAWFFGKPELTAVTLALSASFLIGSLGTQHGAMLVRNMQFGKQAAAGIGGAFIALAVSITLAFNSFSYWSLVWGNLCGGLVTTSLLYILSPFRPGLTSKGSGIWDMLKFGASITAFDIVNYFQRNLDNILIGKFWGQGPLGFYSKAYSLLMLPITSIRGPITAVAFPAMSRLQNEPEALRSYYLKTTSLIALVSMPLTAFFFVASNPIVELVLGRQWLGVAPIFSYLALAAFIQPTSGFAGSLLLSLGQGQRYFTCGLFNSLCLSACFIVGVHWGPIGVAVAYAAGNYVVLYPWLWWAFRKSPVKFSMFAKACYFPVCVSILGILGALFIQSYLSVASPFIHLVVLAASFTFASAPLFFLTREGRKRASMMREIFKQLRNKLPQKE
jgi:PST family polysaccharide transporter